MNDRILLSLLLTSASAACSDDDGPADLVDASTDPDGDGATPTDGNVADVDGSVPPTWSCPQDLAFGTNPLMVATDSGSVLGFAQGNVTAFLGIPYAAEPTGGLRFSPPAAHGCFPTAFVASEFGASCVQLDNSEVPQAIGDEDCLSLNIWSPDARSGANLPVIVFFHGGDHVEGGTSDPLYDGAVLAEAGPAVVVTVNYRLGAFGYLTHPSLNESNRSGNYGLQDQIAALRWVRTSVDSFGGDNTKVMIAGQSSGGSDVCALISSPSAQGLFTRAIIQGGGCRVATKEAAEAVGTSVVEALGCESENAEETATCLRDRAPAHVATAVVAHANPLVDGAFGPHVDGTLLPAQPIRVIGSGVHQHVSVIVGNNVDDSYDFVPEPIHIAEDFQFIQYAEEFLGTYISDEDDIETIMEAYDPTEYASPHAAYVALTTDVRWACPARRILREFVENQEEPVYRYVFGRTLASGVSYHGIELSYLFGHFADDSGATEADEALSASMQFAWTRFASTGEVGDALSGALPYDASTDPFVVIDGMSLAQTGYRATTCDVLEEFEDDLLP